MKTASPLFFRPFTTPVLIGMLVALTASISNHDSQPPKNGVADDWTHHHLIFSNPGSAEDAVKNGSHGRWFNIVNDPRFKVQQIKRSSMAKAGPAAWKDPRDAEDERESTEAETPESTSRINTAQLPRGLFKAPLHRRGRSGNDRERRSKSRRVHTDWSENMGSGATAGLGVFPAKFSFTTGSANCASAASPDFVVYNTGLAGSASQASIIAYDNLYTGCASGSVPSVYWAYNTGGGSIITSVVLSPDGSQISFAQTSAGVASLVILKWAASASETAAAPLTLSATSTGSYRGCSAPCMTSISFSGAANDSGSAPFYDYASDILYVGDDAGKLHKFTGVFFGTPSETAGAWPVSVSTSALSSPVLDSGSGNIFVGDYLLSAVSTCALSGNPCGFFYSIKASSAALVGKSNRLDFINGIVDSPLVDSAAGMAYVFVGADGQSGSPSACGANIPCSGVFQFPANFTSGSGVETTVGPGFEFLLSGAFDNTYLNSGAPLSPSGHLYVVGNTGSANNTLYQISISSNVMNTASTAGPAVSDNFTNGFFAAGLQVTEFFSAGHDYVFLSVLSFGMPAACSNTLANGCVMGFDVTSGSINGSTPPTAATTEAGGTSAIIIDNSSLFAGASNIYFTPLANQLCTTSGTSGGCAIQTLQSAP